MAKSVFTHRAGSRYDDLPEWRYHFPRTYLRQVERSLGDLIVYYEPRRDRGRQVYFANARVDAIESDVSRPDHFYARMSDYQEFPSPVPFRINNLSFERALQYEDGATNLGAFQRSVRGISEEEFAAVAAFGLTEAAPLASQHSLHEPPPEPFERRIIQQIISRPERDRAFRRLVGNAYQDRCALTGLRIINGGGRSEIDAAHIQPVSDGHNGPDSLRNGLALCKTAHWMFDRGLVTLDDNYKILLANDLVPEDAQRMFSPERTARVPRDLSARPHPAFLAYHRDHIFKG